MAVNLSFIGGAGWQFFDDNGDPLSGGKIYTYAAGTTTPQTTYTSRSGTTPNTNPIILDAAGRTPQQIWSTEGLLYKYVITYANDVQIRVWDNIGGSVVASDLSANLASTSDNAKGDALIGFKQSNSAGFLTGAVARTVNDKLQEIVSVKDFGAVGDGITDDTAAIQKALDTGRGVYVPDGNYLISSTLTMDTTRQKLQFESRNAIITTATDITALRLNATLLEIISGRLAGKATTMASTSAGIQVYNCINGRIVGMDIRGFGYGISMDGGVLTFVNTIDACYIAANTRAGIYSPSNGTTIRGGEIAQSPYGVLHAQLQAGAALAIDRNFSGVIGHPVQILGTVIEAIGIGASIKTISVVNNNGSGLIRVTALAHGFSTGDFIAINNVAGTTEANGVWPINVIDVNTFDLKASTYTNAYVSGGTARRGVGVYSGIGQQAAQVIGCYFESVPVCVQFGDSFKNDGTTPQTSAVLGGTIDGCMVSNSATPTNTAFAVLNRPSNVSVVRNSGFTIAGYELTLINTIGDNWGTAGTVTAFPNYGFTRLYDDFGSSAVTGTIVKPITKNGSISFEAQVPTTQNALTTTTAFRVTNYGGTWNVFIPENILLGAGILFGLGGPTIQTGTGSPEGAVSARVGSLFLRTDGGAGTSLYVKESGTGNTGWAAV